MSHLPDSGLVPVSGSVPPAVREVLRAAGNGNISAGLRLVLEQPTRTPSGAQWIACPALLPDPETADGPAVLACSAGVIAHGIGPAALVLDMEAGRIDLVGVPHPIAGDLSLSALATLAARLLPAVLAACAPDQVDEFGAAVGCGLLVCRLAPGLVQIVAQGQPGATILLPCRQALQLAAELSALLARRVEAHQDAIAGLNALAAREEVTA